MNELAEITFVNNRRRSMLISTMLGILEQNYGEKNESDLFVTRSYDPFMFLLCSRF